MSYQIYILSVCDAIYTLNSYNVVHRVRKVENTPVALKSVGPYCTAKTENFKPRYLMFLRIILIQMLGFTLKYSMMGN